MSAGRVEAEERHREDYSRRSGTCHPWQPGAGLSALRFEAAIARGEGRGGKTAHMRAAESRPVLVSPRLFCSPLRLDRGHSPSRLSGVLRNHGGATIADFTDCSEASPPTEEWAWDVENAGSQRDAKTGRGSIDQACGGRPARSENHGRLDGWRLADGATRCAVSSVAAQAGRIGVCRSAVLAAVPRPG